MSITKAVIDELGLPIDSNNALTLLQVESCLEWMKENTTLEFCIDDIESLKLLPSCAKLFICRYNDLYNRALGVTSESIGGMSQSYDTTSQYTLLWQLAYELLGPYLKNSVKITPAKRKWC